MGIFERLTGKTKLQKLEEWRARIEWLEQAIQEEEGMYSSLQDRHNRLKGHVQFENERLEIYLKPVERSGSIHARSAAEREEQKDKVEKAEHELQQFEAEHGAWIKQHEAYREELANLKKNRPGATKTDIKALADQKQEIEAAISRVQSAIETPAPSLSEATQQLQSEVDILVAEQDELAAAVGLGEASADELTKAQNTLKKKQGELEKAKQAESMAASAQRGYQKRLEKLQTEQEETDRLLREAVSSHVDKVHADAAKRMNEAQRQMNDAYQELYAIHLLERSHGTDRHLNPGEIRLAPPDYHNLPSWIQDEVHTFKPDSDEASGRLQKLKAAAGL
jgi:predicted  nucleic acid-binding Zn-ribbon protein